jgi:hypothetical protein
MAQPTQAEYAARKAELNAQGYVTHRVLESEKAANDVAKCDNLTNPVVEPHYHRGYYVVFALRAEHEALNPSITPSKRGQPTLAPPLKMSGTPQERKPKK